MVPEPELDVTPQLGPDQELDVKLTPQCETELKQDRTERHTGSSDGTDHR